MAGQGVVARYAEPLLVAVDDLSPEAPPGTENVTTVLNWGAWAVTIACVAGVLIVAGAMAVAHRRGEGGEHMSKLGWVMAACILVGGAAPIVNAVTG